MLTMMHDTVVQRMLFNFIYKISIFICINHSRASGHRSPTRNYSPSRSDMGQTSPTKVSHFPLFFSI